MQPGFVYLSCLPYLGLFIDMISSATINGGESGG